MGITEKLSGLVSRYTWSTLALFVLLTLLALTAIVNPLTGQVHLEIDPSANRLIGDEQQPDDLQWEGIRLKEIPQWVKDGKPSPTGRYTFTTWHHWTKDDKPLPSGLFGPVLIRTVAIQ